MEFQPLQKKEDRTWVRKSVVGVVALLLVAGVIGAVVVNKAKLDASMDVDVFNPDSAMGDVVKPLVTEDVVKTDETVYEEPDGDQEYVLDDEVPKTEDDDVDTVLADDTMKDGDKYEDEMAEMDADDDDAVKDFKAGKDIIAKEDSRRRNCRPRCRYVRRCYRVKAGDRNNDDRDDFRRVCRRRRICRCPRGYRLACRRRCRRRCFRRRFRVCRWRRFRRCFRRRRRVRRSSDDHGYKYVTRCRYYRRRTCGWRYRRICRNYCRRYGCRRVCRCRRRSSSA